MWLPYVLCAVLMSKNQNKKNYLFRKKTKTHHIRLISPYYLFLFCPPKTPKLLLIMSPSLYNRHFTVNQFQAVVHSVHSVGFHCFILSSNAL